MNMTANSVQFWLFTGALSTTSTAPTPRPSWRAMGQLHYMWWMVMGFK